MNMMISILSPVRQPLVGGASPAFANSKTGSGIPFQVERAPSSLDFSGSLVYRDQRVQSNQSDHGLSSSCNHGNNLG
jgi:hypothetical protein